LPANCARAAGPAAGALLWSLSESYTPVLAALALMSATGALAYWRATRETGAR
jgi:hypothetical protein